MACQLATLTGHFDTKKCNYSFQTFKSYLRGTYDYVKIFVYHIGNLLTWGKALKSFKTMIPRLHVK